MSLRREHKQLASPMGEIMTTLLFVVDAWFELAHESSPGRYQSADRVEVLGLLVRLVALRFYGFRSLPGSEDLVPTVTKASVGLKICSHRIPPRTKSLQRQLLHYGFRVEARAGTSDREVNVICGSLEGAKILIFNPRRSLGQDHAHRHGHRL